LTLGYLSIFLKDFKDMAWPFWYFIFKTLLLFKALGFLNLCRWLRLLGHGLEFFALRMGQFWSFKGGHRFLGHKVNDFHASWAWI
jgi:hypothetical protein